MDSLLERLCTLTGHRIQPLCDWVVRRDTFWRAMQETAPSQVHSDLRTRFESGVNQLPFPPAASTVAGDQFEPTTRRFKNKSA
jgi:hypothetical protein